MIKKDQIEDFVSASAKILLDQRKLYQDRLIYKATYVDTFTDMDVLDTISDDYSNLDAIVGSSGFNFLIKKTDGSLRFISKEWKDDDMNGYGIHSAENMLFTGYRNDLEPLSSGNYGLSTIQFRTTSVETEIDNVSSRYVVYGIGFGATSVLNYPSRFGISFFRSRVKAPPAHGHTWSEINEKPTTFTPAAHNHDAGDTNSGIFDVARIPNLAATKITQTSSYRFVSDAEKTLWNNPSHNVSNISGQYRTLLTSNRGTIFLATTPGALVIPTGLPIYFYCYLHNASETANDIRFSPQAGVTIITPNGLSVPPLGKALLLKTGTETFTVSGDLSPMTTGDMYTGTGIYVGIGGRIYNQGTPSSATVYNIDYVDLHGKARCFIKCATKPTFTGNYNVLVEWTRGDGFIANTDLEMVIEGIDQNGKIAVYFLIR